MSTKVFVYSIPRKTATGISEFTSDVSGKTLGKVKVGRTKDGLQALYSPKVGGLANYISYTPWIENGVQKVDEKGNPMTLQDKMEAKWNKPKGYFTNTPWRDGDSLLDEKLTYFQRKKWKLNDGCTVFDMANMDDELGYYMLLGSAFCTNSLKEYQAHLWPRAQYYIAIENESDEIVYSKNQAKSNTFAKLHSSDFTLAYKRKFVALLELTSNPNAVLTEQQIHNLLFEFIDKTTFLPGSNLDKFNELFNLLSTPVGREEIEARFILAQAMYLAMVREKQSTYTWIRSKGPIVLGEKYSEAIDFLMNPKKAGLVEELLVEIKAKLT